MKIELEVSELVALQRGAEVESLTSQLADSQAGVQRQYNLNADLQEKVYQLEDQLRYASKPAVPQNFTLEQLSEIFEVFLAPNKYSPGHPNKIATIKKVREVFQCGLREAKMVVEGTHHTDTYKPNNPFYGT